MKLSSQQKKDIINSIKNANYKKLVNYLTKFKVFSSCKTVLKEYLNRQQFLIKNKLKFKSGEYAILTEKMDKELFVVIQSLNNPHHPYEKVTG